jgi:hypothetical protein
MYCLTVTHNIVYGFEDRVDRRVDSFMGDRNKVFKDAFYYYGGKMPPSIDFMEVDYEPYLNALIKSLGSGGSYYEYHLQQLKE